MLQKHCVVAFPAGSPYILLDPCMESVPDSLLRNSATWLAQYMGAVLYPSTDPQKDPSSHAAHRLCSSMSLRATQVKSPGSGVFRKCPYDDGPLGVMGGGLSEDCRDRQRGCYGKQRSGQNGLRLAIPPVTDLGSLPPSSGCMWRDQKGTTYRSQ